MLNFLCGLTIGILVTVGIVFIGTSDKFNGLIIGIIIGISCTVVSFILLLNNIGNEKNDNRDYWWKYGKQPPWEEDDELD